MGLEDPKDFQRRVHFDLMLRDAMVALESRHELPFVVKAESASGRLHVRFERVTPKPLVAVILREIVKEDAPVWPAHIVVADRSGTVILDVSSEEFQGPCEVAPLLPGAIKGAERRLAMLEGEGEVEEAERTRELLAGMRDALLKRAREAGPGE